MIAHGNKKKVNDKRSLCELGGSLPPDFYNCIRSRSTTKGIWDTLKENYQGNKRTKKSSVTKCLSELAKFKQKENESIEAYYDRKNDLIFRCN